MSDKTITPTLLKERKAAIATRMPAVMDQIASAFYVREQEFTLNLQKAALQGSSRREKLLNINQVVSEVRSISAPFSACTSGCANCCYQRVMLSQTEADAIGRKIGRPARQLPTTYRMPAAKIFGRSTPCTFLNGAQCSIYDYRPFVCRNMVNLDIDNLLCSFDNLELGLKGDPAFVGIPLQDPGPLLIAYQRVAANDVTGDIRDFFPT